MNFSSMRKRIFLVDDHPLVREWLAQLINQQADLVVCGEAESAPAALSALCAKQPDLAIVDISLKNSSGLELIKNLKKLTPDLPVLVLSMHDESLYALRVFQAGARGYINKSETAPKVIEAIRRILEGKLYMSEKTVELMASRAITGKDLVSSTPAERLSDRELEIFERLGWGLGTSQIAREFGTSMKTIQAHCARIKEKLNLTSATALLREAIRWDESKNLH